MPYGQGVWEVRQERPLTIGNGRGKKLRVLVGEIAGPWITGILDIGTASNGGRPPFEP